MAKRLIITKQPNDNVLDGVFAGINYISVMRDGAPLVNIFQKGEGNPLAAIFPTFKVESVAAHEEKVKGLGGGVLLPSNHCPCTETAFVVCVDISSNQFMIKEPKGF
ncbi:MAG: hypothetical protein JNJ50_29780 [Acidobacteria bacterium]|nr:hypothetical protein [Acidobacteriota bacterium]